MLRGFYTAASALDVATRNHEVVAQNLAHADMPGFRRSVVSFETYYQAAAQASVNGRSVQAGSAVPEVRTVFEPGQLQFTGNQLDLGLRGDSFFVLEGPHGPLYTRNGVFQINGQGELQSAGGLPVTGVGGRITIPPGTAQITVREDGGVMADRSEVGRLQLAQFADPRGLAPAGTTLFEAPVGVQSETGTSSVHQGYREMSNVAVVDEMVQMIAGMRHYESAQRALRALSDAVELDTNPRTG